MVFLFLCLYLRLYDIIFSHMDNVQKQRGSIVLYKEERNGADYIRIEYVNSQAVALLLAQDTDVEKAGNSSAYMPATAFKLPDFYDRYSPHAYIDYSRVYVRHPKPKREYTLPKGYLELLEQKRYSLSTIKAYKIYFSDFMEYHKGQDLDLLTVEDINSYMLHMVKEKHISATQQNMRINAIKFYYEKVRKGKRQYYGGIARAKEYKALPEVLSREEMKSIFAQLSNRKHRCMISLIYSAGLRRSELLNLTPQDIISERMLIRIAGKGKKCRYSLLSEKLLNELREQQRKRANNLMHVRVPAVDGQTVVFQASLYHIAVVAVGMVSRAEVNDDLYTGITHLCQQPVAATSRHSPASHSFVIDRGKVNNGVSHQCLIQSIGLVDN